MDIKIRNVPTQVAYEIDKIAKDEGISQNTLYNKIISDLPVRNPLYEQAQ